MDAKTYISLNIDEMTRLEQAGFEAIALYLLFKQKANFRTGELGAFHRQKLTYAGFARAMDRPATQGRAAVTFDSTDIKRMIVQLEALGLVAETCWDGKRLKLRLPLSPLWKGNDAATAAKLPRTAVSESARNADATAVSVQSPVPLSVMTSERGSIPFFNTAITTDTGGGESAAGPSKERAAQAPRPAARTLTDEELATAFDELFADELSKGLHHRATSPDEALVASFRAMVAARGGLMADTPVSRDYYVAWAQRQITVEQLDAALSEWASINANAPFKPGDINTLLFPVQRPTYSRNTHQRPRHSGVVL